MSSKKDSLLERGLPASIDSERSILGALLLNNDHYFDDLSDLAIADFALDSHRKIYECMNDMLSGVSGSYSHVDIVTLSNELKNRKIVASVGGIAYLASLTEGLPQRASIAEYVRIVKDKAKLRQLIQIGQGLMTEAVEQSSSANDVMDWANHRLESLAAEEMGEAVKVGVACHAVHDVILSRKDDPVDETVLDMTWGVEPLDLKTKGMFGGEMTVIGGESGGFKTSLMLQAVLANALKGTPCQIFSMEMSKEQLIQRMYPILSEIITAGMIRDPRLLIFKERQVEMKRLTALIATLPIWIDDSSPLTLPKMIARAKMMRRKHKVRLIAADYFQLIKFPGKTGVEMTEAISFGLRDFIRKEQDAHLLVLSQYAKATGFKGKRGRGDFYGGQVIHQAAQNALLVSVESPDKRDPDDLLDAEIRIDKQRNGPTGKVPARLDRDHFKFVPQISQGEKPDVSSPSTSNSHSRSSATVANGKDRSAGT